MLPVNVSIPALYCAVSIVSEQLWIGVIVHLGQKESSLVLNVDI